MKTTIHFLIFFFTTCLYSQNIIGEYKIYRKNYNIKFKENKTFERLCSVGMCGTGIFTEGFYTITSDTLTLNYKSLNYVNPKIIKENIEPNHIIDSLQVINIKIFDPNINQGLEGYTIELNGKMYFSNPDGSIKIIVKPASGQLHIKTINLDLLKDLYISKENNYQIVFLVDLVTPEIEKFKVVRLNKEMLVLKTERGKKIKLMKN